MTATKAPTLDIDQALELGNDLLCQLAPHAGDLDQLNEVFSRWVDVLGPQGLVRVCAAALRTAFAECLIPTPIDDLPDGAHVYRNPDTKEHE